MAFEPLIWYCRPVANGVWAKVVDSAFGPYTTCAIDSLVICISHLVLLCLGIYRIWLIKKSSNANKFHLRSNYYNCMLALLAAYCTAEPLLRSALYLYISNLVGQTLFGILLFVYIPSLDTYPDYVMMRAESLDNADYEALPGGEHICPERTASIFSRIYFGWITPLMQLGYRKPITEKDVWKLDTWDQTEILIEKFQRSWVEESQQHKPWLLRALNNSLEGRFWLGGFFKVHKLTLSNINLDIPVGSLVAIVGGSGEGKTSLISAMLGELPALEDASVVIRGSVAYVPQISWIFNGVTASFSDLRNSLSQLRENVLFGSEFEPTRYWKAIDVTALQHDLDLLTGRDLTEIGERGVNISGGQKQRVSMARAVYSNSNVYIFDDSLSALDAHVGRQVFNSCIKEELHGKTRILVMNHLNFLPQVDRIILVSEGMIKEEGTFEELSRHGKLFQQLMENAGKMEEMNEGEEKDEHQNLHQKTSKPSANGVSEVNELPGSNRYTKKGKGGKSVLIRQEERET